MSREGDVQISEPRSGLGIGKVAVREWRFSWGEFQVQNLQ